jgi:hypothetical protein
MFKFSPAALKSLLAGACLSLALGAVHAAEVAGVKLDDSVKVAGKELVLNGAGVRTKIIFKVYVAGLYLPLKTHDVAEILKMDGPRRVTLVMMRDISSDDFGEAFMSGLNANTSQMEQSKILNQTMKFGEMFALLPGLKKGDVLHMDYIPGTGTVSELNGKKIGTPAPGIEFYNAVLRIWLGDHPVDRSLKGHLIGAH